MPIIGLSILIQILCAVHCVRTRRNQMWLMVIIFLSIPGCLAYAFFEILPQYSGRREVRAVKDAAIRKLDPSRQLRAARDAVDLTDTTANRTALGDALAGEEDWAGAAEQYRLALSRMPHGDRPLQIKLAAAELEAGDAKTARELLETLPASASQSENDRAALLLARALEQCGETASALTLYSELGQRMAGAEALCRQALLLRGQQRDREALPVLEEIEKRAKRLDRFQRGRDGEMYDWAARSLKEMRGV